MSEYTVVYAGINKEINNEDIAVPVSMGPRMSDVIGIMLTHQVVFENTLPFDAMVPNSTTTAVMQDATDGKPESFDGIEELIEDLKMQD